MAENFQPKQMSQRELDGYLEDLVDRDLDDSPEFHKAYAEWERREENP